MGDVEEYNHVKGWCLECYGRCPRGGLLLPVLQPRDRPWYLPVVALQPRKEGEWNTEKERVYGHFNIGLAFI